MQLYVKSNRHIPAGCFFLVYISSCLRYKMIWIVRNISMKLSFQLVDRIGLTIPTTSTISGYLNAIWTLVSYSLKPSRAKKTANMILVMSNSVMHRPVMNIFWIHIKYNKGIPKPDIQLHQSTLVRYSLGILDHPRPDIQLNQPTLVRYSLGILGHARLDIQLNQPSLVRCSLGILGHTRLDIQLNQPILARYSFGIIDHSRLDIQLNQPNFVRHSLGIFDYARLDIQLKHPMLARFSLCIRGHSRLDIQLNQLSLARYSFGILDHSSSIYEWNSLTW